jgi:PGF-pre-PGF domain-containing protein
MDVMGPTGTLYIKMKIKFLNLIFLTFIFLIPFSSSTTLTSGTNLTSGSRDLIFLAFEGDSLSTVSNLGTWPTKLVNIYSFFQNPLYSIFVAKSGDTIENMVTEYGLQVSPYTVISDDERYFFLWAGTNDLGSGVNSVTTYENLKIEWANARADGFIIVAFTIMNRTDFIGTKYTNWTDLNNLILSDNTLYDYLIRPDLLFPDATDSTYFLDGIHLTNVANEILAQNVSSYFPSEPNRTGLNSTIQVSFTLTFDKLEFLDNAITFYNLTYTHPSSCSQQSSYSIYNFTTPNVTTSTNDFPSIACPEEEDDGGSSGGGGGGSAVLTSTEKSTTIYWNNILFNQEKSSIINVNGIYLTNISIKTLQNISSASAKIQTLNLQNNSNLFSGLNLNNIFQAFQINKTGIPNENISEISFEFKVNNSWLVNKNILNIVLQRKQNESATWEILNTIFLRTDENYSYFKSFSNGFSYFAIYYHEIVDEEDNLEDSPNEEEIELEEPGNILGDVRRDFGNLIFWGIVILIILGILLVGFFLIKKRIKTKKKVKKRKT